jgi:hypothetical protein
VASAILKGIRDKDEVAYLVGVSPKLAEEYIGLYERYKDKQGATEEIGHLVRFNEVPLFEDEDPRKKGGAR